MVLCGGSHQHQTNSEKATMWRKLQVWQKQGMWFKAKAALIVRELRWFVPANQQLCSRVLLKPSGSWQNMIWLLLKPGYFNMCLQFWLRIFSLLCPTCTKWRAQDYLLADQYKHMHPCTLKPIISQPHPKTSIVCAKATDLAIVITSA